MSEQSLNEVLSKLFAASPQTKTADAPVVGELRRACFVPELRGIDEKNRTIDFVASTEAVDRYGDRLMTKGWKLDQYRKNPVFLWAHDTRQPPIGKTLDVHVEQGPKPALIQRVQFADKTTYEFADTVFNLYRGQYLRSVSVGFLPTESPEPLIDDATGRMTGYQFNAMELLELSAVPLPANPEAVARALDERIIRVDDVAKVFTPQEELATTGDYLDLAYNMGMLAHAAERLEVVVRDAAPILTVGNLKRIMGKRPSERVASVEDLERLFRLE